MARSPQIPGPYYDPADNPYEPVGVFLVAGGAGQAATIADGADVAQGTTTDPAYADATGAAAGTIIKLLKGLFVATKAVAPLTYLVSTTFVRPADTTPYALGDLVANSVTPGSVVPMSFVIGRDATSGGMIRRVRLRKTSTSIAAASFRVHLYSTAPTVTNGDNGAWLSNDAANYAGSFDVTMDRAFSDGAAGNGAPNIGSEVNFVVQTYYALLEARDAYIPASGETFALTLEVIPN